MADPARRRPLRNPFVRMRFHAGECVLILGRKTYGVGAFELAVWQRCDGHTTIRDIADALLKRIPGETLSEERVTAIVEREVDCGLLSDYPKTPAHVWWRRTGAVRRPQSAK